MKARRVGAITLALALAGCSTPKPAPPEEATLASLSSRQPDLTSDPGLKPTPEQTIAAYRRFIEVAVDVPQRAEALRRLGDLEMDSADRRAALADEAAVPDYRAARARYEEFLKAYPQAPKTDRVLYQLARAQEQAGELEAALVTLTTLVTQHPGTLHTAEAQFRRGEMLFAKRDYALAEAAYDAVLRYERRGLSRMEGTEVASSPLVERALYMQGWSLYKLARLDEALAAFFEVLDLKLAGLPPIPREESELADIRQLTRADRELLEDTLRVVGISLSNLQGAATIARYVEGPGSPSASVTLLRERYQFRVYQQLADLYLKQERAKDAADTLAAFVRLQPLHVQAPAMLARVVQIYAERGFTQQALQARREHVRRFGATDDGEAYQRANPTGWRLAQPQVRDNLSELARHHHSRSQNTRTAAEADEAARWYRALLEQFPDAPDAAEKRFLLAELLFENRRWAEAASEYEVVAYAEARAPDKRSADAGYAALLSYAEMERAAADETARRELQRQAIASAQRFAQAHTGDVRSAAVLVRAAEQLQALGTAAEGEQAHVLARQALDLSPVPTLRRAAWVVIAQQAFESGQALQAEAAYTEVLALSEAKAPVAEKLAAAIVAQAEAARQAGRTREAVGHFDRVAALGGLPANSALRINAQFDAATLLVGLQDWPAAARALEDFRRQRPGHVLQAEVAPKLALVYEAQQRPTLAAAEYERIAEQAQAADIARSALWRAAELRDTSVQAWERYLQRYPQPLESAVQARWKLAELARQAGAAPRATAWLKELRQADASAGDARTPLTRTLAGRAALLLAEPTVAAYRAVPLVEPLARQLKLKKAKFEEATKAYAEAAQAGVTEVVTAATFHTAALYQDFGRALMTSSRPKKLSKAEIEQYNVMLEEQAFPFEEQAIALHESNARRAAAGIYDAAVRDSYAELARLKPARWGKTERSDTALPLNQQGIAQRQQGQFDEARRSYEAAIANDSRAAAPQLNLAILLDLYLDDAARATPLYQRVADLSPADAPTINKWLAELKARKPVTTNAATASSVRKEPS